MKLHIGSVHIYLVGSGREFGEVIGLPDGSMKEIKESLTEYVKDSNLELYSKGRTWTVRGTWREFSDFIGLPEAINLNEFSMSFKELHPEVEITLRPPE